jgi:predicted nucleic acid-binding protein
MTQEIIEMARESGMELYGLGKNRARFVYHLEAFAKLIAAAEREACAKACEDMQNGWASDDHIKCAAAIRARGE